jgi:hypothetical protein
VFSQKLITEFSTKLFSKLQKNVMQYLTYAFVVTKMAAGVGPSGQHPLIVTYILSFCLMTEPEYYAVNLSFFSFVSFTFFGTFSFSTSMFQKV